MRILNFMRWLGFKGSVAVALATLALVIPGDRAISGPGSDTAVASNRSEMCLLPPFLNVAITEKPNIMILYDNSTSMSLPAYTRPYDPTKHYYGYFDHDACYQSNNKQFSKNGIFEVETVEVNGVWVENEAWKSDPDRTSVHNNAHRCDIGAHANTAFPYSGNFLNWLTMRRIDLLRKAFTGGLGSNSGTQSAQYIAAEGTQTGGADKFAPCFTKSYSGLGVSPYGINQVKVVDGQAIWGEQCAVNEEVITAKLRVPVRSNKPESTYAFANPDIATTNLSFEAPRRRARLYGSARAFTKPSPQISGAKPRPYSATRFRIAGFRPPALPSRTELPKVVQIATPISAQAQPIRQPQPSAVARPWHQRAPIVLASLFDVISDVGMGLLGAPRPDLKITALSFSPASGVPGSTVAMTITVNNAGGANFSGTTDITATIGGANAAGTCSVSNINSGASKTVTCNFAVPSLAVGAYPVVATVDPFDNVNEGSAAAESNNSFTAPQNFNVTRPNLRVTLTSFTPSSGGPGTPVSYSLLVQNAGSGSAPATTLEIRFRDSFGAETSSGTCSAPALNAGQSATVNCTLNAPGVPQGTYALVAVIDPANAVPETDETDNRDVVLPGFTIVVPDLIVQINAFSPAADVPSANVNFTLTVRNIGLGSAPASVVVIAWRNGASTPAAPACSVPALASGVGAMINCTVQVPNVPVDTFYDLVATVDPSNSIPESDETNNTDTRISAFYVKKPPAPDLKLQIVDYDLKAGLVGLPVKVLVRLRNVGDGPALGPIGVRIAWGATPGVGACSYPGNLAANTEDFLLCTFNVPAVPTGVLYTLNGMVDPANTIAEDDEGNNTDSNSSPGFYVHVNTGSSRPLDLQVVSITPRDPYKDSALPGSSFQVDIVLANVGYYDIDFAANAVSLLLSDDGVFVPGDTDIKKAGTVCDLPALKAYPDPSWYQTITCTVAIPPDIQVDRFQTNSYIVALVQSNLVQNPPRSENPDKAPNSAGRPYFLRYLDPALSIPTLTATPSVNLTPSATFTLDVAVKNAGRSTTFGNLTDRPLRFYWSADAVLDALDTELLTTTGACQGSQTVGDGATRTFSCQLTVPPTAVNGTYYVFAIVDPAFTASPAESAADDNGNGIPDERENNTQSTVVVVGPPSVSVDLTISNLNVPVATSPGQTLGVTLRLSNIGSSSTVTWPTVRIYFDAVGGSTSSDCSVGKNLAAGEFKDMTCTVVVPGTSGTPSVVIGSTYTVRAVADPANLILESNETNNTAIGVTQVQNLTACTGGAACTHTLKVDWGNRGRVGILWSFRKKALGVLAPANLGVTTINDWLQTSPYTMTGHGFQGVHQNQQPANNIIPHLESAGPLYDGKLARTMLNVVNYYANLAGFNETGGGAHDPMLYDPVSNTDTGPHPCRSNYILLISDGYSFNDWDPLPPSVPIGVGDLKDYQSNATDPTLSPTYSLLDSQHYSVTVPQPSVSPTLRTIGDGSYHLDNVARYAHDNDIRPDIPGKQTVKTVVVHAFSSSDVDNTQAVNATRLLRTTAIQGGYVEQDNPSNGPDKVREFDSDADGRPDTYFEAREGDDIGQVILNALNSILLKTASGTSVSVIAATARGEGAVFQSYFRPTTAEATQEVTWLGYLQAMWVDRFNNLREDTDQDGALSMVDDYIIQYDFNSTSFETVAYLWQDTDADGTPDELKAGPIPLSRLRPILEAGKRLFFRDAADRKILSWPHWPTDAVPSNAYPVRDFTDTEASTFKKFLWPSSNAYYNDQNMTELLIRWVRGSAINDVTFRNRLITIDGQLREWKLGDIVYSTPTIVGAPEERYDLLYGKKVAGYSEFFIANKSRRRMVIVGANDGMMHAFNSGVFRDGDNPTTVREEAAWYDPQGIELGEELWAYIPGSLLQNLRILADAGYDTTCHVYFMDLKPKVTDAQIFFDSTGQPLTDPEDPTDPNNVNGRHIMGWGTILIGGMRLGCGKIEYSSYFIMDITKPKEPALLAEFGPLTKTSDGSSISDTASVTDLRDLNFSYFYPIVTRVDDGVSMPIPPAFGGGSFVPGKWYLVVGSGPSELRFNNTKTKTGIYVFDLSNLGNRSTPVRYLQEFAHAINAFDNNPATPIPAQSGGVGGVVVAGGVTADLDADYNVDTAYLVTQIDRRAAATDPQRWGSEMWRLIFKDNTGTPQPTNPRRWRLSRFFTTAGAYCTGGAQCYQPMVAQPSIARDPGNNIYVYSGTGRFHYKKDLDPLVNDLNYNYEQSLYGIIDPCWTGSLPAGAPYDYCSIQPYNRSNLIDATQIDTYVIKTSPTYVHYDGPGKTQICSTATCTQADLYQSVTAGLVDSTKRKFGWVRNLPGAYSSSVINVREMSYNKPAVAGGFVLFTTYLPGYNSSSDTCALSGASYLYVLDYRAGTASPEDVFASVPTNTTTPQRVEYRQMGDQAPPSPPAIYNNVVFVQSSTARPLAIETQAQFRLPPGIRGWQEQ